MLGINVLSELARSKVKYEFSGDDKVKICCPFHHDESPSCEVYIKDESFKCYAASCGQGGDILHLLAQARGIPRHKVREELGKIYPLVDDEKIIDAELIERYNKALTSPEARELLEELYNRAIRDDDIRKYRLGYIDGKDPRISIPVKNKAGQWVDVRKYKPGAPGREKMRHAAGYGKPRLYPYDQLQYEKIAIVGGELKAIVTARELNPHGIGAISATGGEGNWHPKLTEEFAGKDCCYIGDIDDAGQKAANTVCATLSRTVSRIRNALLPLPADKFPKGDPNDFARINGNFLAVWESATEWTPSLSTSNRFADSEDSDGVAAVSLNSAVHARNAGRRMSWQAVPAAILPAPYALASKFIIHCDKKQKWCGACPISYQPDDAIHTIPMEHPALIKMAGASTERMRDATSDGLAIPKACRVWAPEEKGFYNAEEAKLSPQLDISSRGGERSMQNAIVIGDGLELNETYEFTGRMHPSPLNQQATLLVSKYTPAKTALSTFTLPPAELLEIFKPSAWTVAAIDAKLQNIYDDFTYNVTRIRGRRYLHEVVDLSYHSPLVFDFEGREQHGWFQLLIIGDTSQGKSEVLRSLRDHYQLGEIVDGKNCSAAGLIGGLQQFNQKWFNTWGVLVTHDGRYVIIEEAKGMPLDVTSQLTQVRSSGYAEIVKIEKRKALARCRLTMASNPRSDRPMNSYGHGVETIRELMGNPEDIRRFDLAIGVAKGDVSLDIINTPFYDWTPVPHTYTSEACRALVLFAWTRRASHIQFELAAVQAIFRNSIALMEKYTEDIPLIDRGSTRTKVAKLAAALAIRTMSVEPDRETVLVRECHVEYVTRLIDTLYSSPALAYDEYTASRMTSMALDDASKIVVGKTLLECPHAEDVMKHIYSSPVFDMADVQDWSGTDIDATRALVGVLVRRNALKRTGRHYHKNPDFVMLLKKIKAMNQLQRKAEFNYQDNPNPVYGQREM